MKKLSFILLLTAVLAAITLGLSGCGCEWGKPKNQFRVELTKLDGSTKVLFVETEVLALDNNYPQLRGDSLVVWVYGEFVTVENDVCDIYDITLLQRYDAVIDKISTKNRWMKLINR